MSKPVSQDRLVCQNSVSQTTGFTVHTFFGNVNYDLPHILRARVRVRWIKHSVHSKNTPLSIDSQLRSMFSWSEQTLDAEDKNNMHALICRTDINIQQSNLSSHWLEVGHFHVNSRFQPTTVGWNLRFNTEICNSPPSGHPSMFSLQITWGKHFLPTAFNTSTACSL